MSSPPTHDAHAERAAFTRRVRGVYTELVRFCARRAGPTAAEDIAADALATAWARRANGPSRDDDWRAWVFGIARNHLLNAGRATTRRDALAIRLSQHANAQADHSETADLRIDLATAWNRLTPAQQEVIALTAWDGLTAAQAAAVLDIAPVAYRVRLTRARSALRAHLDATATARPALYLAPANGANS